MSKNKKVYCVFIESPEMQAMFDEKGELLDFWFCNDASWRTEYFSGFMSKMGIEVIDRIQDKKFKLKLEAKLKKIAEDY